MMSMDVEVLMIRDAQDEYIASLSQRIIQSIPSRAVYHLWCTLFTYIEAIFVINKNRYATEHVVKELTPARIVASKIVVVVQHGSSRPEFMGIPL